MKTTFTALLFTLALAATAPMAAERPQDRWNLSDLYASARAFNDDVARLESQFPLMAACKGQLGESPRRLRECLDLQSDVIKRYFRLAVYANELLSEDTGNAESLSLRQKVGVLGSRLAESTSFVRPELLAIGASRIDAFFRDEPGLAIYRHPVNDILRAAPHTLDTAGESIVASFQLAARQSGGIYGILANADMPWPTVKLSDGTEVKLDQSAYTLHREAANRDDRKKVMDAFFGQWKQFERTLGVAFYGSLKEDTVYTKVRKHPDSLTRALDGNRIPRAVYDALIKSTNEHLPTLHRYFRLRANMLGVKEMRYYDIYPPLVGGGRKYPIDEAVQIMLESVKPLGGEYVAAMKKGIEER